MPRRGRNLVLIAAGFFFYAWGAAGSCSRAALDACRLAARIGRPERAPRGRHPPGGGARALAVVAEPRVAHLLQVRGVPAQPATDALSALGSSRHVSTHVLLPIGISFFTFEKISYLVDIWRGDVRARAEPARLAAVRLPLPAARSRARSCGCARSTISSARGPCASTTSTEGAHALRARPRQEGGRSRTRGAGRGRGVREPARDPTTTGAWLGALAYTLQIYFDFSGYSDMAIGLAQVFGFRLPENFNRPYSAVSITDFWRRWHMTLSRWFRDYLYIPLGGNRGSAGRDVPQPRARLRARRRSGTERSGRSYLGRLPRRRC